LGSQPRSAHAETRVARVAFGESPNHETPSCGDETSTCVYSIGVAEHNNYFVEKQLVHNCISRYSKDFRPAYSQLAGLVREFPRAQIIAVTATADRDVERDIWDVLNVRDYVRKIYPPDRPNLEYEIQYDANEVDIAGEVQLSLESHGGVAIVYCATRKACDELAAKLSSNGVQARAYHAGMQRALRTETQNLFMAGMVQCIVATNAFGMGVDKVDVRLVYHYHMPGSLFDYVQECVAGDSMITYADMTQKPARVVVVGDELLTLVDGVPVGRKVSRVFTGSSDKWLSIKTSNGSALEVTPNHPIMIDGQEVLAKDVQVGSVLCTHRSVRTIGSTVRNWRTHLSKIGNLYVRLTPDVFDTLSTELTAKRLAEIIGCKRYSDRLAYRTKKRVKRESFIEMCNLSGLQFKGLRCGYKDGGLELNLDLTDADMGYLVGIVATDGNLKLSKGFNNARNSHTIRLYNSDLRIIRRVESLFQKMLVPFRRETVAPSTVFNTKPCYVLSCSSALVFRLCV
jgi:hypothetical protein